MQTILLIDDDEALRSLIVAALQDAGYDVIEAANGATGADLARHHLPDLIISDVVMQGADGYDLLKVLRQDPATAGIPLILVTGYGSKDGMRRGMQEGADDYLTKPFKLAELLAAVAARFKKKQVLKREAEKALSELRANIVLSLPHELRTPLACILGLSDAILANEKNIPPDVLEMVKSIEASGRRLQRLVERFLIYAQVELLAVSPHDRLTAWQNAPVSSAAELLKIVASQCAYPARRFNDLVLDLEDGRAAISDELFTQLARELVDNAFKFSKAGALVKITARPGPQRYEIQVQDHGRGMQVQEIKAVGALMQFQRKFYEQKGSGLGLIIARRLAEIHGGALTVQSTAGQGTTVNVTLPAADASAEP